jgi:hypothetical protein
MAAPGNCGTGPWTRAETGINPPAVSGILFGSEFTAYEQATKHQKIALDLRGVVTYVGKGRYYNEISDLFGKLMTTGDNIQHGGA